MKKIIFLLKNYVFLYYNIMEKEMRVLKWYYTII